MNEQIPPVPISRQPMRRARVGVTGLAAIALLVALATAIASGARDRTALGNAANGAASSNATDEPLAKLGVTPGADAPAERR